MKKILNNTILQKTIIAMTLVLLISNFIFPTVVNADVGGALYSPIQSLTIALGDTMMWLVNSCSGYRFYPILFIEENIDWGNAFKNAGMVIVNPGLWGTMAVDAVCEWLGQEGVPVIDALPNRLEIPVFAVTPEKIFSNQVPLLDANIINPQAGSAAATLQGIVSKWYNTLRNFAAVGLLSVLVYVAIRMIISSTVQDKSKYKQMFMDWLVAFCLLFFMHYIMSFAITMVDGLTNSITQNSNYMRLDVTVQDISEKYNVIEGTDEYDLIQSMADDEGYIVTDITSYVRFAAQTTQDGEQYVTQKMAYTIMYLTLVIYTVMFLFIYIKRLIYIIFLTIIAPLVALTYPIDRINDGKSQAFNMWLKEYIFNLLIQPVHLLLYTVLLGTALSLATKYLIYPLVVLGFMLPAEKILRKMFGFEKSGTASSIVNGALGGALVMKGMGMLKGGSKKGSPKGGTDKSADASKVRMAARKADKDIDDDQFLASTLGVGKEASVQGSNKTSEELALEKYTQEGFGQNEEGYYYNPWTGKYDEKYDPTKDEVYTVNEFNNREIKGQNQIRFDEQEEIEKQQKEMQELEKEQKAVKIDDKPKFFKGAQSLAGRYIGDNLGKMGKGTLKGIAKGVGAATLGSVGIAAGLASDDYANVLTYGATGMGIGASIGGSASNLPSSAYKKAKEAQEIYRQGAYSKEQYEKMKNAQLDAQYMKNAAVQRLYKDAFSKQGKINGQEAWKVAMQKSLEYRKHGITDNDLIIKAMKAKKGSVSSDFADPRRIISAKLSQGVQNEKDVENIKNRLRDRNIREAQIIDQAEMIREITGLF